MDRVAENQRPAGGAFARAGARLKGRWGFRLASLGLLWVGSIAVFAPFLASDRPLYLHGIHHGEFARARRTLVPVVEALVSLLSSSEAEFEARRAAGATQELAAARAAEAAALRTRLADLGRSLESERREAVRTFERRVEAATAAARGSADRLDAAQGEELLREARTLRDRLDPAQVALVPARSFPLVQALQPLEVGLCVAWLFALVAPFLRARVRARTVLAAGGLAGLTVGLLWGTLVGAGRSFETAHFKDQLTTGQIEALDVIFAPVAYGLAEQHGEEGLRPPTWLASSEIDERGAYVRGARVPRPDPVTGFVPATRPIEVRVGEPPRNSPWRHLLGTDTTGRDLLARVIHGSRVSLAVGCLAAALLLGIGVAVGALAGYFGGLLDLLLSRLIEVVVSFPLLFLVMAAVTFVGPSIWNVILVLGCVGWTGVARLARSEFQRERELEYVAAARALGFSWPRIVLRHVLPNTLAPLLVAATFAVAGSILVESALSFLGYGVRVPLASWGGLTSESRELSHWWLQLFPGLVLFATVLCVQLVGDALRDALDPRGDETSSATSVGGVS